VEAKSQLIIDYINSNGDAPVRDWLNDLDPVIVVRLQARIKRLESGNFGDSKSIGSGIYPSRAENLAIEGEDVER